MIEIAEFKPEEIDDTIEALDTLQGILVPFFKKMNFEGLGEQDAPDFVRSITLAKHALIAMVNFLEKKMKGVDEVKELATLRAERDAAVRALEGSCHECKHYTGFHHRGKCINCRHDFYGAQGHSNWEWRGPQQEET